MSQKPRITSFSDLDKVLRNDGTYNMQKRNQAYAIDIPTEELRDFKEVMQKPYLRVIENHKKKVRITSNLLGPDTTFYCDNTALGFNEENAILLRIENQTSGITEEYYHYVGDTPNLVKRGDLAFYARRDPKSLFLKRTYKTVETKNGTLSLLVEEETDFCEDGPYYKVTLSKRLEDMELSNQDDIPEERSSIDLDNAPIFRWTYYSNSKDEVCILPCSTSPYAAKGYVFKRFSQKDKDGIDRTIYSCEDIKNRCSGVIVPDSGLNLYEESDKKLPEVFYLSWQKSQVQKDEEYPCAAKAIFTGKNDYLSLVKSHNAVIIKHVPREKSNYEYEGNAFSSPNKRFMVKDFASAGKLINLIPMQEEFKEFIKRFFTSYVKQNSSKIASLGTHSFDELLNYIKSADLASSMDNILEVISDILRVPIDDILDRPREKQIKELD